MPLPSTAIALPEPQGMIVKQVGHASLVTPILLAQTKSPPVPTTVMVTVDGTLFVVPFDADTLELSGAPVPVIEDIAHNATLGVAHFSVSSSGAIAYMSGQTAVAASRLVFVDREGGEELLSEENAYFDAPRLSPDEQRIAVGIRGDNIDIWVYDVVRGNMSRLT